MVRIEQFDLSTAAPVAAPVAIPADRSKGAAMLRAAEVARLDRLVGEPVFGRLLRDPEQAGFGTFPD